MSFNAVTEEIDEEEDQTGDGQTNAGGNQIFLGRLGRNLSTHLGIVNQLSLVCIRRQGDGVFLTLLKQHQVQAGFHLLLTTNLGEQTLVFG